MSKSKGAGSTVGTIISVLFGVLLLLGIAGIVTYFALRDQGVTYYVECGGQKVYANTDGANISLQSGKPYEFFVKTLTGGEVNYSVKVTSNSANNFTFVHNGVPKKFYGTDETDNDYSKVFGLKKETDKFTINIPKGFKVEKAIEEKYGGSIEFQEEIKSGLCYFVIAVTADGSKVNLYFSVDRKVTGIEISPPSVVF